jgi:hypothetical protein
MRYTHRFPRILVGATALCLVVGGCGDDDKPNDTDRTPPTVTSTAPANNATGVEADADISAEFSEDMDSATINASTFKLSRGGVPVTGTVHYSADPGATFDPDSSLLANTQYTATITTGAEDRAGNALEADYTWSFTTGASPDPLAPVVVGTSPMGGAFNVAVSSLITATFSEPLDPSTVTIATFTLDLGAVPVSGTVSFAGVTATFDPAVDLAPGSVYTATVTTDVTDLAGNHLAENFVWTFTTSPPPDVVPPSVIAITPANGATGVAVDINVTATFSEAMNPATINASSFLVRHGGAPIPGVVGYAGTTATFNPDGEFPFGAQLTATITTAAADLAGNALVTENTWSFTTVAAPDVTPPTVVATTPADGESDVEYDVSITATFSEPMDASTLTTATFTLQQGGTPVAGTVGYAGGVATFDPAVDLSPGLVYTAAINTAAADAAGNTLAAPHVWTFSTRSLIDITPPTVVATLPTDGATEISPDVILSVEFSEPMDPATVSNATFTLRKNDTPVDGTVGYSGTTATFTPLGSLPSGALCTATITIGATDTAGNALAAEYSWTFTIAGSADTTPPTVLATTPGHTADNIPTTALVTAIFSEAMDPGTINSATFTVTDGITPVPGTVSYMLGVATFDPDNLLTPGTQYTATITTGVADAAGNSLAIPHSWTFMTESAPTVTSTTPASGGSNVAINAKIAAIFSKAMDPATVTTATFLVQQGAVPVPGTVSYQDKIAIFDPDVNLTPSAPYTVTITTGAKDVSGNGLTVDKVWSFTTGASTDLGAPAVLATSPANGAGNISTSTTIRATFTESMDPSTLNASIFQVRLGTAVKFGTVTYSEATKTATFTPFSPLASGSVYNCTITVGAKDIAGNALSSEKNWTFTTRP